MANGNNGRNSSGQFVKGNIGGPGNPYCKQVAHLRAAMLSAITDDDVEAVVKKVIEKAKEGDINAVKIFLTYAVGTAQPYQDPDVVVKLDKEQKIFESL